MGKELNHRYTAQCVDYSLRDPSIGVELGIALILLISIAFLLPGLMFYNMCESLCRLQTVKCVRIPLLYCYAEREEFGGYERVVSHLWLPIALMLLPCYIILNCLIREVTLVSICLREVVVTRGLLLRKVMRIPFTNIDNVYLEAYRIRFGEGERVLVNIIYTDQKGESKRIRFALNSVKDLQYIIEAFRSIGIEPYWR